MSKPRDVPDEFKKVPWWMRIVIALAIILGIVVPLIDWGVI